MTEFFSLLLKMTWTGSIVILVILPVRALLRHAPRCTSFSLWSVVLFRLLCPFSLSVEHAPLAPVTPPLQALSPVTNTLTPLPNTGSVLQIPSTLEPLPSLFPTLLELCSWIWCVGAVIWFVALAGSILKTHWRLREAIRIADRLYCSDQIDVPFSFGRTIYLPFGLTQTETDYILLHEHYHIHRLDPFWNLLGLVALGLHWFNPLCWLAFYLAQRDMEMSCDEGVMNTLEHDGRTAYSALLLQLSSGSVRRSAVLPFGEESPEQRIRNVLRWKRPSTHTLLSCAVMATVVIVLLAVNPSSSSVESPPDTPEDSLTALLRDCELTDAQGKTLPPLNVIEVLLHEGFRDPAVVEPFPMDRLWTLRLSLRATGSTDTETVTLDCGMQHPGVVRLFGATRFRDPLFVEAPSLYDLIQHANGPDFDENKIPYIDDPEAYAKLYPLITEFLDQDLGKNGVHTKSTLTHFLAVRTAQHPLGVKVYYIGFYAMADPSDRTFELFDGAAYADAQGRLYDLVPCQSLVTVDGSPIGFVSEDWLQGNDLNYPSQAALIEEILSQGHPVST